MLQFQEADNTNQDTPSSENGVLFPQSVLNSVCNDWNINESEGLGLQGNISQDKEFNFGPFQCNCSSLPASFSDSSWNMGFQFGGNQYTPSACCLFEQQTKKQADCALPPILSDIEPFLGKDIENKYIDYGIISGKQGSSSTSSDCRFLSCMQSQQPVNLPLYNSSFPAQDSTMLQYNSLNTSSYNFCVEADCIDKLCSPTKNQYSSCILEQNLDMNNMRTENIHRVSDCKLDLSSFIPLNNGDDTILNVNESDDDSEIIVEDSDTESEVSIDVGPYMSEKEVVKEAVMRCFVCNLSYSEKLDFVQVNSSFPLTFISQTPVMLKLIEIIPIDMQTSVKFENSLICKRCLNLIDMIENLEVRLVSVKKAICDFVSRSSKDVPDEEWSLLQGNNDISMEDSIVKNIEPLTSKEVEETTLTASEHATEETSDKMDENVNMSIELNSDTANKNLSESLDNFDGSVRQSINNNIDKTLVSDVNETSKFDESANQVNDNVTGTIDKPEKVKDFNKKISTNVNNDRSSKISLELEKTQHFVERKYQCDRCGKIYRREEELSHHLKKHAGEFLEKCPDCGKGFMKKSNLEVHLRKHRNHICVNCRASFESDVGLSEHSKNCTGNSFSCSECKLIFTSEIKLNNHKEKHKVDPNICNICNKSFKHPSYLVAHMKSHSDEKPFSCEKCGRNYKNQNHLKRHLKTHDNQLKCLKCKKIFLSSLELKNHSIFHMEEVECEICKKKMSKNYISEHMKLHQNTKKKKECPICKKMLTTSIKVHMSKHAEIKEYKCEICLVEFTFKHSLTKHMRLKHKGC